MTTPVMLLAVTVAIAGAAGLLAWTLARRAKR